MALEVFAKLNNLGESASEDHIFTGRKQDFTNVHKWLNEQYAANKRKKAIQMLSELFLIRSQFEEPFLRLNKKETIAFHQALHDLYQTKKSKALKMVVDMLGESLWIY